MIIGFAGTQKGMSNNQKEQVWKLLTHIRIHIAHHGDCIGADAQFHKMLQELKIPIVIHPASGVGEKRAFCAGFDYIKPEKSPLTRNKDIVDVSHVMIAAPKGEKEQIRSGTWATIRYALKMKKPIYIIYPNGKTVLKGDI